MKILLLGFYNQLMLHFSFFMLSMILFATRLSWFTKFCTKIYFENNYLKKKVLVMEESKILKFKFLAFCVL